MIMICTVLSWLLILPQFAAAKSFEIIGQDLEPYYYKDPSAGVQGAYYEIMKSACDKVKLDCKFKLAPFRTSLEMIKQGTADAGGPFMKSHQRQAALNYSEKISKAHFTFYGLPETAKNIRSYKDLAGYTVGTLSPSLVAISLQKINEFIGNKMTIVEESSGITFMRKTESRAYPLSYAESSAADLWIAKNHSPLVEIPGLGESYDLYVVFSKKSVNADLYKKLSEAIVELKKSGELKKIAEKYKIELSD